jgi:2-polyprenyl-3-methyl-5-hydroxy-6-metoxy-1,4-benzoquinol methylase
MLYKFGDFRPTSYKGIQELAAFNLHPYVFKIAKPYLVTGSLVLDFGCGQGAFSQRLIDDGMIVDVCDLDITQVKAHVRKRYQIDLNTADIRASVEGKYDFVIAIEIIEHLQNPWKFLADCISVLKNKGIIVLSTPNISNLLSRLRLLMKGTLLAYEKSDLVHGHITPLSFVQLENMFGHYNLKILQKGWAGPIPLFHFYNISRFSVLRNTVLPLLYPFLGGPKEGRSLVYILEKEG